MSHINSNHFISNRAYALNRDCIDKENSPIINSINEHMKKWYPELYQNNKQNKQEDKNKEQKVS